MFTLAIEHSTDHGSLALLDGERVAMERTCASATAGSQWLFTALHGLVADAGLDLAAIARFAVGLGPGAFASLRMAVAAARALALPGGQPVIGVSSAEALAWDVFRETAGERVAVIGDARRDRVWCGVFVSRDGAPERQADWAVIPLDALPAAAAQPGTVWVSPDAHRLSERLKAVRPATVRLIEERRVPRACAVGLLAARRARDPAAAAVPAPIYLHPPVSVAPRYA